MMSSCRRLQVFLSCLVLLMTCLEATGVKVIPMNEENCKDALNIVRSPAAKLEDADEEPMNMMQNTEESENVVEVSDPSVMYYMEMGHGSDQRDLSGKRSLPRSSLKLRLIDFPSELLHGGRKTPRGKSEERTLKGSLNPRIRPTVQNLEFSRSIVQECGDQDPKCRQHETGDEPWKRAVQKRREFVIDLGKRSQDYRKSFGKQFFSQLQNEKAIPPHWRTYLCVFPCASLPGSLPGF